MTCTVILQEAAHQQKTVSKKLLARQLRAEHHVRIAAMCIALTVVNQESATLLMRQTDSFGFHPESPNSAALDQKAKDTENNAHRGATIAVLDNAQETICCGYPAFAPAHKQEKMNTATSLNGATAVFFVIHKKSVCHPAVLVDRAAVTVAFAAVMTCTATEMYTSVWTLCGRLLRGTLQNLQETLQ